MEALKPQQCSRNVSLAFFFFSRRDIGSNRAKSRRIIAAVYRLALVSRFNDEKKRERTSRLKFVRRISDLKLFDGRVFKRARVRSRDNNIYII